VHAAFVLEVSRWNGSICKRCQQVSLSAQHYLSLVLNALDRQHGVARVLFDLPLSLGLSRVTHRQQCAAGKDSGKRHQRQQ